MLPADFGGARVALLESRLAAETAAMVRRLGGDPVSAPSLAEREVEADDAVGAFIDRLAVLREPVVVFLTGAAVTRLFAVSDRLGRGPALLEGLSSAVIVARGPKPAGALTRLGLSIGPTVREPFTTAEVIGTLQAIAVEGRDVTVLHYGERNAPIVSHLEARGARVLELTLYEWRLPGDVAPLSRAIDALIAGEIRVLALTSQVQVRHLLEVAGPSRREPLLTALSTTTLVGAVGPTCAAACADAGIAGVIAPERPKLAPLLQALALAHAARHARSDQPASPDGKERT